MSEAYFVYVCLYGTAIVDIHTCKKMNKVDNQVYPGINQKPNNISIYSTVC